MRSSAILAGVLVLSSCQLEKAPGPEPTAPNDPSLPAPRPTPRARATATPAPTASPTATPTARPTATPDTGEPVFTPYTANPTEGAPLRPNRSAVWIAPPSRDLVSCLEAEVEGACTAAAITVCSAASGVEVRFRTLSGPGTCGLRFVYRERSGAARTLFTTAPVRG